MYHILIADDEKSARDGLSHFLKCNCPDYEVTGMAVNGEDALKLSERILPDVIITDINMPKMNGLDYIEAIKGILPDVRILVISGYDKFEYAVQCLRMGVREYFLKPVSTKKLTEVLAQIKSELDELYDSWNKKNQAENQEDFDSLSSMVKAAIRYGEQGTGSYLPDALYCSVAAKGGDDGKILIEILRTRFGNKARVLTITVEKGNCLMVLQLPDEEQLKAFLMITRILTMVHNFIKKEDHLNINFFIGRFARTMEELQQSCKDALSSAVFDLLEYAAPVSSYEEILVRQEHNCLSPPAELCKELAIAAECGNKKIAEETCGQLIQWFAAQDMVCGDFIRSVFLAVSIQALSGKADEKVTMNYKEFQQYQSELEKVNSLKELSEVFLRFMEGLQKKNTEEKEAKYLIGKKAEAIMLENLDNCEFTLDDVASRLFLSPNYLRALFKKELGITFTEYLTQMRMQQATIFLKGNNLKVGEVAERVGYRDSRYFSSSFKKIYHMSPGEYQNLE